MTDVVNKYGIIWVASAGNQGPALSTVGTPPALQTSSILGNRIAFKTSKLIASLTNWLVF